MVCGLCHREPSDHTLSTSGPSRCEYDTHRDNCPGGFYTSCKDQKTKLESSTTEESDKKVDNSMETLEKDLSSLSLTPKTTTHTNDVTPCSAGSCSS